MNKKVVPMIHVPDVRATVDWYESIGFNVVSLWPLDQTTFKPVAFDNATITFNIKDGLTFTQDGHEMELIRQDCQDFSG